MIKIYKGVFCNSQRSFTNIILFVENTGVEPVSPKVHSIKLLTVIVYFTDRQTVEDRVLRADSRQDPPLGLSPRTAFGFLFTSNRCSYLIYIRLPCGNLQGDDEHYVFCHLKISRY